MPDILMIISANSNIILSIIIIIVIILFYVFLERFFTRKIRKNKNVILDDVSSGIKFFNRLVTGYLILITLVYFYNLPSWIILLLTSLVSVIVGLSSIQIINNFFAGLAIIILRPYVVNDYISTGTYEGRVVSITLNYTKLLTLNDVFVLIPNNTVLNRDLINYTIEHKIKRDQNSYLGDLKGLFSQFTESKITRYSFALSLPLDNLSQVLTNLDKVCDKYSSTFGYKPSFFAINLGWKIQYQFIVETENSEIIRTKLKPFRNELLKTIYPN